VAQLAPPPALSGRAGSIGSAPLISTEERKMLIHTLAFASIAAAGAGLTFTATPAPAAEKPRACVVDTADAMACYDTFTEAIAKATGGRITNAPDNARKAANDPRLAAELNALATKPAGRSGQAGTVIEIAWENSDFGGTSYTFTAPSGCTSTLNDIDFSASNVPSGFELRLYQNYGNCYSKHYEYPNFEGRSVGWVGGGVLPFPAKSIQWS